MAGGRHRLLRIKAIKIVVTCYGQAVQTAAAGVAWIYGDWLREHALKRGAKRGVADPALLKLSIPVPYTLYKHFDFSASPQKVDGKGFGVIPSVMSTG